MCSCLGEASDSNTSLHQQPKKVGRGSSKWNAKQLTRLTPDLEVSWRVRTNDRRRLRSNRLRYSAIGRVGIGHVRLTTIINTTHLFRILHHPHAFNESRFPSLYRARHPSSPINGPLSLISPCSTTDLFCPFSRLLTSLTLPCFTQWPTDADADTDTNAPDVMAQAIRSGVLNLILTISTLPLCHCASVSVEWCPQPDFVHSSCSRSYGAGCLPRPSASRNGCPHGKVRSSDASVHQTPDVLTFPILSLLLHSFGGHSLGEYSALASVAKCEFSEPVVHTDFARPVS